MKVAIYDQTGKKASDKAFPSVLAEVKINPTLIHEAIIRQQANARHAIAHTKTKGEVRGGGRKPYRQKGTGNARQGSIRNPHYIGGGVAFGPRSDRNFSKDMPRKQRKLALLGALKKRIEEDAVFGITPYAGDAKTREFVAMLSKLPQGRSYVIFTSGDSALLERVSANIPNVSVLDIKRLNICDVVKHDKVVFVDAAIDEFETVFLSSNK